MTVDFVYRLCQYIINKNQQGYLSPDEFNLAINQAQYSYLDFLLGSFEQYSPGRPIAKVELGMNETIRQRLTAFIDPAVTLTVDGTGLAPYPADYQQADAMYTSTMQRIRYIQQDRLYHVLEDPIDPVATNPIYLIQSNGFQFYPITIGTAKLSYVGTPDTIVWASTPDPNGRPVYDPVNSVDPKWYDLDMFEVTIRALKIISRNLQLPSVDQLATEIKQIGQ